MKRKTKRFLIIVAAICAFTCLFAVGCKGCKSCGCSDKPPAQEVQISLKETSVVLGVGEEMDLSLSLSNAEGLQVSFTSSDPAVATVDENGKVVGMSEGATTIIAACGGASATCEVEVSLRGEVPTLTFTQLFENEVAVAINDTLDLSAFVSVNGKTFTDVQLSVTVDEEYGTFENNVFTPKKIGETELTVVASWRGMSSPYFTKTLALNIIDAVEMYINNGEKSAFVLYTSDVTGEKTEMDFAVTAKKNGEVKQGTQISVLDDAIAKYENGKLYAVGEGQTHIQVTNAEIGITKNFPVSVKIPVVPYTGDPIEFSAMDGDLNVDEILIGETLRRAEQGDKALTVKNGKILGVTPNVVSLGDGESYVEETEIVVYGEKVAYAVTLNAYTMILDEASDFAVFDITRDKMDVFDTGYYVLGCDIEYDETWEGVEHAGIVGETTNQCGFAGTFDGRGHSVTINVGDKGLFGSVTRGGTIKNVALHIENMRNYGLGQNGGYGGKATYGIFMKDVYVSVDLDKASQPANAVALFGNCTGSGTFENVVVRIDYTEKATSSMRRGSLFMASAAAHTHTFKDCYVITADEDYELAKYYHTKDVNGVLTVTTDYIVYADNDATGRGVKHGDKVPVSADEDVSGYAHERDLFVFKGLRRYTSLGEMQADMKNCSFDGYDADCWDMSAGVPVWKNTMKAEQLSLRANGEIINDSVALEAIGDTVKLQATYDGADMSESLNVRIEYVSGNASVVEIDGNEITGLEQGEVTLRVAYSYGGVTYRQELKVLVGIEYVTHQQTIELFSAMDGDFDYAQIVRANETVTAAYQDGVALTVNQSANKLLGLTPNIVSGRIEPVTVQLWTDSTIYTVMINAYTMVIDETEDLRIFELSITNPFYDAATATCIVTGYYVLGRDITYDASWASNQHTVTGYFSGIFDGLGHTMEFNAQAGGLFNSLQYGGTVKNVAAICHLKTGTNSASTINSSWSVLASSLGNGTSANVGNIENCYLKVAELVYSPYRAYNGWFVLGSHLNGYSTVHNVIAEIDSTITNYVDGYYAGTFWMLGGENTGSKNVSEMKDVYCIFNGEKIPVGGRQVSGKTTWINHWAANDTAENWTESEYYKADNFVQEKEVFRFATLAEMATDTTYGATQVGNWKVATSGVEWTDDVR